MKKKTILKGIISILLFMIIYLCIFIYVINKNGLLKNILSEPIKYVKTHVVDKYIFGNEL